MSQGRVQRSRLLGRRSECEALDRLLTERSPVGAGSLVLRGEAGVGKSALLELPVRACRRLARRDGRRRRVGDGAGLQRPASALRTDARSPRSAARPATRRARDGVRPERRARAGPVPGRARHADPVRRGRRAATARLHRRRRAVARPGVGADPRLRRPPPPRRADRARLRRAHGHRRRRPRRAARAVRSAGSATAMRARCCWRTCTARSMRPSATRSSPRATATRSRCSSCRAPGTPQSSPAGSGCPDSQPVVGKIEESYVAAPPTAPRRHAAARPRRGRRAARRPVLLHRAAETLGIDMAAADPAVDAGLLAGRRARRVRAPARPLRRLPLGGGRGPPPRASRARRGHRPRDGPGPAGLAPRPRDAGPGRGGRRRARTLGRPGAGSRRRRRRGRVPAARRRADRGPGAARASARSPRRRRASRPARSTRRSGCWPRRRPDRSTSSSAPGWTSCAATSPSPRLRQRRCRRCCSKPRDGSSRSTSSSLARPT